MANKLLTSVLGLVRVFRKLLLPLGLVFLTVLPGYIILRLYPTLLNYNNKTTTTFISLYFLMLFLGSSTAFLLNDFILGPCITIVTALVVEGVTLCFIFIFWSIIHSSDIVLYRLLVFVGYPIGILQASVTALFGDQYDHKLYYGLMNHFHCYLFSHFAAYAVSICLFPLYYHTENYGVCTSSCQQMPFYIAIGCVAISIALVIIISRKSLTKCSLKIGTIPATLSRMKLVLFIFIPFVLFWMLIIVMEHFWIIQGGNMYTKFQRTHLDVARALIVILSIPIAAMVHLSEQLRILLGGLLIIIAALSSNLIGNFDISPYPNISSPSNYNLVTFCNPTRAGMIQYYFNGNLNVRLDIPRLSCFGPYLVNLTRLLREHSFEIPGRISTTNPINKPRNNSESHILTLRITSNNDICTKYVINSRNYRTFSSFPLVRFMDSTIWYTGDPPLIIVYSGVTSGINITLDGRSSGFQEIPPGEYKITQDFSGLNATVHFRSGVFNGTAYFRSGGVYIVMYSMTPNEGCGQHQLLMKPEELVKPYIDYSIFYQAPQYILLGIGKMLIFSSGLEITYALAEKDLKCSLIGIFWGIYYLANLFYYSIHSNINWHILNSIFVISQYMTATIIVFYFLYSYLAYKLTDVLLALDENDTVSSDNENVDEMIVKSDKEPPTKQPDSKPEKKVNKRRQKIETKNSEKVPDKVPEKE